VCVCVCFLKLPQLSCWSHDQCLLRQIEVRSIRQGPYAVFTAPYSLNTVYQLKWTSLTSCEVIYRCSLIPVCSAVRTEHVRSLRIGISLKMAKYLVKSTSQSTYGRMERNTCDTAFPHACGDVRAHVIVCFGFARQTLNNVASVL